MAKEPKIKVEDDPGAEDLFLRETGKALSTPPAESEIGSYKSGNANKVADVCCV